MRAGAIGHEDGVLRPLRHLRRDDLALRQVDRARHVSLGVQSGAADIEQHEIRAFRKGVVHIPAIGLEGERRGEMLLRHSAGSGGRRGDI